MKPYIERANAALPLGEESYDYLESQVKDRLQPDEYLGDVVVAGAYLGAWRAELLGRPGMDKDVAFALSIFTWYPLKPDPAPEVEQSLLRLRPLVIRGVHDTDPSTWRREHQLAQVVSPRVLTATLKDLFSWQQESIASFLELPSGASAEA